MRSVVSTVLYASPTSLGRASLTSDTVAGPLSQITSMSRNSASVKWGDFFRAKRPRSFNYEIKSILQRNAARVNYKIKSSATGGLGQAQLPFTLGFGPPSRRRCKTCEAAGLK